MTTFLWHFVNVLWHDMNYIWKWIRKLVIWTYYHGMYKWWGHKYVHVGMKLVNGDRHWNNKKDWCQFYIRYKDLVTCFTHKIVACGDYIGKQEIYSWMTLRMPLIKKTFLSTKRKWITKWEKKLFLVIQLIHLLILIGTFTDRVDIWNSEVWNTFSLPNVFRRWYYC